MVIGFENSLSQVRFVVSVKISAKIFYLIVKKRKWKYTVAWFRHWKRRAKKIGRKIKIFLPIRSSFMTNHNSIFNQS